MVVAGESLQRGLERVAGLRHSQGRCGQAGAILQWRWWNEDSKQKADEPGACTSDGEDGGFTDGR